MARIRKKNRVQEEKTKLKNKRGRFTEKEYLAGQFAGGPRDESDGEILWR